MPAISSGSTAPDFKLKGWDGKEYRPGGLPTGGAAVLVFYKTTCPTCQYALPFLEKIYRHHRGDQKVRFLAVAQEDTEAAKSFAGQYDLTLPTALDSSPYSVSAQYGLTHVPTLFLVNADGKVEQTTVGFVKKEYEALVDRLARLTGRPKAQPFAGVSVPELKPG